MARCRAVLSRAAYDAAGRGVLHHGGVLPAVVHGGRYPVEVQPCLVRHPVRRRLHARGRRARPLRAAAGMCQDVMRATGRWCTWADRRAKQAVATLDP